MNGYSEAGKVWFRLDEGIQIPFALGLRRFDQQTLGHQLYPIVA